MMTTIPAVHIAADSYSENQEYYNCKICVGDRVVFKDVKVQDFSLGKWVFGIAGIAPIGDRSVASNCLHMYLDFLVLNLDLNNKKTLFQKPGWQIIQTTVELLMSVAKAFNLLIPKEISVYSERFSSAILDVIQNNNSRLLAQNPVTILCTALNLAIDDEIIPYCPLVSVVTDYDNVIFYKDEYIYITQKACAAIVNAYIKDNDINLAEFSPNRVAETLEGSHIIKPVMEGKTKRKATKLPGYGSKRFMKLSLAEFNKYVKLN